MLLAELLLSSLADIAMATSNHRQEGREASLAITAIIEQACFLPEQAGVYRHPVSGVRICGDGSPCERTMKKGERRGRSPSP